jgi:hypothetical protein
LQSSVVVGLAGRRRSSGGRKNAENDAVSRLFSDLLKGFLEQASSLPFSGGERVVGSEPTVFDHPPGTSKIDGGVDR